MILSTCAKTLNWTMLMIQRCRDDGNGYATCTEKICQEEVPATCTRSKEVFSHKDCRTITDYCNRDVKRDWCEYQTQEWMQLDVWSVTGNGHDYHWHDAHPDSDQRVRYEATYRLNIGYDCTGSVSTSLTHSVEILLPEYESWRIGDEVILDVSYWGVSTYRPGSSLA